MKKRITLIILTLIISSTLLGQKLSLTDLTNLCSKKNWQDVNQFMLTKGWTYYDSTKGDTDHYSTITWSYNKENYSDKAQGWFYVYTYDYYPNKISYSIFNKASYLLIQNSLSANGFKVVDSEIEDEKVISTYSNLGYTLIITNEKRSDEDRDDRSFASYNITLIKKSGIYDSDNGKKTDYYDDNTVKMEYNLVNGKLNGLFKYYDEDGNLSKSGNYSNGLLNGKIIEYEKGVKTAEYFMTNGKNNGLLTFYEDNKVSYTRTYKDDVINGEYIGFYYDDTNKKLSAKEIGQYLENEKSGTWKLNFIDGTTEKTLSYTNYLKGIKEGAFQEVKGDSLIVGNYKADELNGAYKAYVDIQKSLVGGVINTNISQLTLVQEGQYTNGKKSGNWKNYDVTGTLSEEGNFNDDLQEGEHNYYYPNYVKENGEPEPFAKKLVLKQTFSNGKLNGKTQRFYYQEEIEYPCDEVDENGAKIDTCTKLKIDKIYETSYYQDDELNGIYELRDSINQIIAKGQHKNNVKEGKWFTYTQGNKIKKESNYINDKLEGEEVEYNDSSRPLKIKQYESGRIKQIVINDSLGKNRKLKFDVIERTSDYVKVKKTEYLDTRIASMVFWLKNDTEDDDNFELDFLLKTSKKFGSDLGYTDGELLLSTLNNEPLITGLLLKDNKIGTWTYYYYDQNVKLEKKFIDNAVVNELYLKLDGTPFSGEFVFDNTEESIKEERKIKDGLRNGKTEYIDTKTKKTVKKEMYKDGKLKE